MQVGKTYNPLVKRPRVKRWAWFWERIGRRKGRLYGYIYNPYLKSAQDCLDNFNAIQGANLTLKDVYITWED